MRETNPLSGKDTRSVIAATVRAELARANVSGSQMAQRIGVAESSFSRRATGEVSFSAEEILAIATELGIPSATFLERALAVDLTPASAA